MPRPCKCRRICEEPSYEHFIPEGISCNEKVVLSVDEYEIIRIIDLEKKTHKQCAEIMDISRTTVTEIYEKARYKIADCLVNGKVLTISGGNYRLCDGKAENLCGRKCPYKVAAKCSKIIKPKGANQMRVAVTYENGVIFQHFGHTETFKFYDIEENSVVNTQVVSTLGEGHGALAGFLNQNKADVLICGGIGGGAKNALADAGIKLYGGVSGDADKAVQDFLNGSLDFNPDVKCSHHDNENHQHNCGKHSCGNNC